MIVVGLLAGLVTCLLFAMVVGPAAYGDSFEALLPGVVAGLWVFWGVILFMGLRRMTLLHPTPRSYRIGVDEAIASISEYLGESVVMYGEPWRRIGHWPEAGRLAYEIIWTDTVVKEKSGHFIKIDQTPEILRRRVVLELSIHEKAPGFTVVRLDWDVEAEGSFNTADHLVSITTRDITAGLGAGLMVPDRAVPIVEPPPWWLLVATAVMVAVVGNGLGKPLEEMGREKTYMKTTAGDIKQRLRDQVANTRWELSQWAKYKKANHIE